MGPAFLLRPGWEKKFCYGNNIPLCIGLLTLIFVREEAVRRNSLKIKDKALGASFGMVVALI
jgi:hypothetical protein